ncbi:protein OSCP1 isoform X2 [Heterocephalus glaber]|uniref:Protein OSCP1 isoform X2 n=1 Tax=Heterocephalus glaber TaxID=10181 RepID=A0AAX6QYR9_HETGA|nr:protein OSCP1 isoform X2 [Heterocephalus glaber]
MSVRTLPLLFLNLGGEMLYILDQRLRAQNIPGDKARKVLNDIIMTMFNRKFMEELFKPQELYSKKALRTIYDRLAHASIMRLNQASMDKLYDLMTMAFKYQVLLCPRPKDVLLVTFNHLDAIKGFIQDSPTILHQVDETFRQLTEVYGAISAGEFQLIRQTLLLFFQDLHIRVSIFLKDRVQNSNGRFVLPVSGPVPWGTEVPGLIRIRKPSDHPCLETVPRCHTLYFRMFNSKGEEVKKIEFKHGGNYVTAHKEGSFELYGDRVLKLGTNMYSVSRPVETHMSGASKNLASRTQESIAPNPLAKEELNFLARLMGGMEIKKPSGPEPGFRLNLFTTDEEEEHAALSRPEELSYEVINIQATQDQQQNEELARIMGELQITEQPRQSTTKGDDLLAMMDEL